MSPRNRQKVVRDSRPGNAVKSPVSDESYLDMTLEFRLKFLSHDKHALADAGKSDLKRLLKKLASIEGMTIREARNCNILADYSTTNPANQGFADRFVSHMDSAGVEEVEHIACLKVEQSQDGRVYGYRNLNRFHIVYWDPKHALMPEGKKKR